MAAYPDDGWEDALQLIHDEIVEDAREVVDYMREEPPPQRLSLLPDYCEITFPRIDGKLYPVGTLAHALRILDGMAATKDSMLSNEGILHLAFDGYNDDPSQVWDIEQPAQIIRHLHRFAPWWPWLVAPQQIILWIGALLAKGPSVVSSTIGWIRVR